MPDFVNDFAANPAQEVALRAQAFVALVDLEFYTAFVSAKADRLDLLQHLCRAMEALNATMWEVPEGDLSLLFHWQADDPARALRGDPSLASGTIRTSGRLGLLNDETLLAAARQTHGDLVDCNGVHQLVVPPGIYAASVRNAMETCGRSSKVRYSVTLNHHPHPPPRRQPVRLTGLDRPLTKVVRPNSSLRVEIKSHKMP